MLQSGRLFYYKTWEDYGAGERPTNHGKPIDLAHYEPKLLDANNPDGPNRFDLVPTDDPLARRWELQAASVQELHDWIDALRESRKIALTRGDS